MHWIEMHPEIIPAMICAGCRRPLGGGPVITLNQGHVEARGHYRIHDDERHFCLSAFHEHRHLMARRALIELGLKPTPDPVDPAQLRRDGKTADAEAIEQRLRQECHPMLVRFRG